MTKTDKEMMLEFLELANQSLVNFIDLAGKYPRLEGQEVLASFLCQEVNRTHTWLSVQQTVDTPKKGGKIKA